MSAVASQNVQLGVFGWDDVGTALAVAQLIGLGKDKKADYKQWDQATRKVIDAYGPNLIAGSQVLNLDPGAVAQATSEYLRDDFKINLTANQILASQQARAATAGAATVAAMTNNWPLIAAGGVGLVVLLYMMKGR